MGQMPVFRNGKFLGSVDSRFAQGDCKHEQLEDIGTCSDGCCDRVRCKGCGREFLIECPD